MHPQITVFVAGIAGPEWPVSALGLGVAANLDNEYHGHASQTAVASCKLSPSDEAALECALKIRDADAVTRINVIVMGTGRGKVEALMRTVAAFKPNDLSGHHVASAELWDAQTTSRRLAKALSDAPGMPDIVLIGQEFGDCDDGAVAPCLAETLAWPFVGLAHEVRVDGAASVFIRERGDIEEHIRLTRSAVASVTRAKSNRLRYPLIKNVIAAKREHLARVARDPVPAVIERRLVSVTPTHAAPRGGAPCRMIRGSIEEQTAELAGYLQALRTAC